MRFVLVHGVVHGGWAWDRTRRDLEALGHEVSTPDLPLTSLDADADVVRAVLDATGGSVTLVGHSYGGLVVSRAAAGRTDVERLVYVAAAMLEPDEVFFELASQYPTPLGSHIVFGDDGTFTVDPAGAIESFYAQCPPDTADASVARLRATAVACLTVAQQTSGWREFSSTYVLCRKDNAIAPELQRLMSSHADAVVEFDTDHSPFLSMPEELLTVLMNDGASDR